MSKGKKRSGARPGRPQPLRGTKGKRKGARLWYVRSEERFSRNAETDLVCRLLLEKKKTDGRDAGDQQVVLDAVVVNDDGVTLSLLASPERRSRFPPPDVRS